MSAALKALKFARSIEGEFKRKELPKTAQEKQALETRVQTVTQEALIHFQECQKEKSPFARSEAYRELTRSLNVVAKRLDDSKDWVSYLRSFLWYSLIERDLREKIHKCFEAQIKSQAEYLFSWLPARSNDDLSLHQGWKFYERWGVKILSRFQWNPFDSFFQSLREKVAQSCQSRAQNLSESYFSDLKGQMKLGTYRVLGTHPYPCNECQIQESGNFVDLKILEQDFLNFTRTFLDNFSPEDVTTINRGLQELDTALKTSTQMLQARTLYDHCAKDKHLDEKHPARIEFTSRLRDVSFQIAQKISLLAPTQSILIPGGYIHLKLQLPAFYRITRLSSNNHKLQLMTTARGVNCLNELLKIGKTALMTNSNPTQFAVYSWTDLKLEEIANTEFIFGIVSAALNTEYSKAGIPSALSGAPQFISDFIKKKGIENAKIEWRHSYPFYDRYPIYLWAEEVLGRPLYKLFELYSLLWGLGDLLYLKQSSAVIQNCAFVQNYPSSQGINDLDKILSIGSDNAVISLNNTPDIMIEMARKIQHRKEQLKLKIQAIQASVEKMSEIKVPELSERLEMLKEGVETLKREYCDATGQNYLGQPVFVCNANAEIQAKWRLYFDEKLKLEQFILQDRRKNTLYLQIQKVFQEAESQIQALEQELELSDKAIEKDKALLRKMEAILAALSVPI